MASLTRYTQTLLGGFQTSAAGAVGHSRVAIRLNAAADAFESLNKGASRTKSEKAIMYKKLQEQHGRAIRADLDTFGKELLARTDSYDNQVASVLNSVSLRDAVQIVAGLKAAGLKNDQLLSAVRDNAEIAIAVARCPQSLTGLTPEVARDAAIKHYPKLTEMADENARDYRAYESIYKAADRTIMQIGLNADEQVIASRFDEARLSPDHAPQTQAQANAAAAGE